MFYNSQRIYNFLIKFNLILAHLINLTLIVSSIFMIIFFFVSLQFGDFFKHRKEIEKRV